MRKLLQLFDFRDVIEEDDDFPPVIDQGRPQLDVVADFPECLFLEYVVGGPRVLIEEALVLYELIEGCERFLRFLVYRSMDVAA